MHHEDEEFGHWKATYSVFRDLEVLKQVLCIVHKNNIILFTKNVGRSLFDKIFQNLQLANFILVFTCN